MLLFPHFRGFDWPTFGLHKASRPWPSVVCVGTIYMPRIALGPPILVDLCDTFKGSLTSPKAQESGSGMSIIGMPTETEL